MTKRGILHVSSELLRSLLNVPGNIKISGITKNHHTNSFDIHLLGTSKTAGLPEMAEGEESMWVTVSEILEGRWRSS